MPKLTFDSFFKALRKGEIPNAVYLHGAEDVLKEEAVAEIISRSLEPSLKDFNFDQRSAADLDPEQAETLCQSLPMMAERRVAIIRDVEAWNKRPKAKATVLKYLEHPAAETILILVQGSGELEIDGDLASRTVAVAAEPLPEDRAGRWLLLHAERHGVVIEEQAAQHMVRATGGSLAALRSELEKLIGLDGKEPLTLERVSEFLGIRHGETPADWGDVVLNGDVGRAVSILPHLLAQPGVSGVSLVTLLGTSIVGIGLARSLYDRGTRGGALAAAIKQTLFRARPATKMSYDQAATGWSRLAPSWSPLRIEAALAALRLADERCKSTTVSDEQAIVFDLVMELTLPWQAAA